MDTDATTEEFTQEQRAAVLLLALGEADAARVLRLLDPREVQRVGEAMASLENLKNGQIDEVVGEFLEAVTDQSGLAMGTGDYLRRMMTAALGPEKADALVERIVGGSTRGLEKLRWMDTRSIADFIRFEHPQIQATVLSYLDPDQAARVLEMFQDDETRSDVVLRIANLDSVAPTALSELNAVLEQQGGGNGGRHAKMGGVQTAAEIMNNIDGKLEASVMEKLEENDGVVAERIQDLMFVFGNLVEVDDRGIQALLREVSSDTLIMALKGAEEPLKQKIFNNMSKRAAELLQDDLEAKGPVRLSEVEGAQKEVLVIARRMADAGEIMLGGGGDEMV